MVDVRLPVTGVASLKLSVASACEKQRRPWAGIEKFNQEVLRWKLGGYSSAPRRALLR
jgi:hypothetical protein